MAKTYPYQEALPIINVKLIGPRKSLKVKALIDSGADCSLFQAEIAQFLGIPLERGRRITLTGIGGKVPAFIHHIPIKIHRHSFDCQIAFSPALKASVNLLGRDNFFLPFLITFNERFQKVLLEKNIQPGKR